MKFGYTIICVQDVTSSIEFFERAFGLKRRFIHESGYGELETGETAWAFASHDLGASNLPGGYVKADQSDRPLGMEMAMVTDGQFPLCELRPWQAKLNPKFTWLCRPIEPGCRAGHAV